MKTIKPLKISLVLWIATLSPLLTHAAVGSQCTQVDCDCSAVPEGKWRQLCEVRETSIIRECQENSGRAKTYCGLHGPMAFPVATSLQKASMQEPVSEATSQDALTKALESQLWSIEQDFKSMQQQESEGNVLKAAQIFNIYRKNARKYFSSQLSLLAQLEGASKKTNVFGDAANGFSAQSEKLTRNLSEFADKLWRNSFKVSDESLIKPYRSFAFKILREAATQSERSAELWAKTGNYEMAARHWQTSVEATKKLLKWESSTANKAKYLAFYKKQATSRLNRATLYWLKANETEKVVENIKSIDESLLKEEKLLLENGVLTQDLQASRFD